MKKRPLERLTIALDKDYPKMSDKTYKNVTKVGGKYYNLEDTCDNCGHAFECNENGSTKMGAYPQMSTLFERCCLFCGKVVPWPLKKGKQPFNHKIDHDYAEDNNDE
jgi:hypothetical protein